MGRVMKCRVCEAELVCAVCGERQTPRKKKTVTATFDPEDLAKIDKAAEEAGLSRSAYLAKLAAEDGEDDE